MHTEFPTLSFNSNKIGPKIVLTCLNHGDEVIGLNSALELFSFVQKCENFVGELVIFPCLNEAGFWRSSRFFEVQNLDGAPNMNRIWPGDEKTFAGIVAKKIFEEIVAQKPDLVLDLHSYATSSLVHIIVDRPGGIMEKNLINICQKSQTPFYLEYQSETLQAQMLDKCLSNQLCLQKIPSLTVELGPKGSFSPKQAKIALQALINLLFASGNLTQNKLENKLENSNFDANFDTKTEKISQNQSKQDQKVEFSEKDFSKNSSKTLDKTNLQTFTKNLNLTDSQTNSLQTNSTENFPEKLQTVPRETMSNLQNLFELQSTEIDQNEIYFREGIYAGTDSFGFFRFKKIVGELIEKGEIVIEIVNFSGEIVNILMPKKGFVIAVDDVAVVYPRRQLAVFIQKKEK